MRLFLPQHYAAFEQPKPGLDTASVIAERRQVREAFLQLDEMLWPFIHQSRWDIHRHRQVVHYVSSDHFIYLPDGTPIVNNIGSMWLHYGKSPSQLDFVKNIGDGYDYHKLDKDEYFNAFYLHTRIQFYINATCFRCWLLLATDKNYYDRSVYLKKLIPGRPERQVFYRLISGLFDKGFFYEIDSERLQLQTGLTEDRLFRFIRRDRGGVYSGIVKEYKSDDPILEMNRIEAAMIENLKLLYPLYDFMAWRPNI